MRPTAAQTTTAEQLQALIGTFSQAVDALAALRVSLSRSSDETLQACGSRLSPTLAAAIGVVEDLEDETDAVKLGSTEQLVEPSRDLLDAMRAPTLDVRELRRRINTLLDIVEALQRRTTRR